jgi:hypothetical protein
LKKLLTIFLLLLTAQIVLAQEYTLRGRLKMNTGEVFAYKLVFTANAHGDIKGYSYTYTEPNDTKTAIVGVLDKHSRRLTFSEKTIAYSHDVHTTAYMCLVDANLDYEHTGTGNALTGPINGAEADRTACTGGTVLFDLDAELEALFNTAEKFDTVITMGHKPKPVAAPAPTPSGIDPKVIPVPTDKVTKGVEKTYEWHSDTVVAEIWDGGTVDGDKVSVYFNGVPVLSDYFLMRQKKVVRIPISGYGFNALSILALNEGSEPPNTADILLHDGKITYSILAYNNKGQSALIKIKRVK